MSGEGTWEAQRRPAAAPGLPPPSPAPHLQPSCAPACSGRVLVGSAPALLRGTLQADEGPGEILCSFPNRSQPSALRSQLTSIIQPPAVHSGPRSPASDGPSHSMPKIL